LIVKCKICGGNGFVGSGDVFGSVFGQDRKPCPLCKGAGEIDLNVPKEKLTTCKFCAGRGLIPSGNMLISKATICPTCRGFGLLERPQIGSEGIATAKPETAPSTRPPDNEYDLAISFAGEDRHIVQSYAEAIKSHGLNIFFADFEAVDLWGTNLYDTFDAIYRLKAHYCVIFLSKHYAAKVWTNHERRSAQARALTENREYILPVRLDDTEIPGISPTIGYLDFERVGQEELVRATLEKLARYKTTKAG
jgi:hypothetical protein